MNYYSAAFMLRRLAVNFNASKTNSSQKQISYTELLLHYRLFSSGRFISINHANLA
ncbi:MAG: hypothetical protein IAX21_10850 [Candidatus Bathyarchaeota archaeon]|nr:hypothetical protein [Candidatus Bathyarchaeum tardum]WNZ29110.1 MAG: hypothetical protein IAX21_10850 [Candidatus Bathyarchaeota archaeon]